MKKKGKIRGRKKKIINYILLILTLILIIYSIWIFLLKPIKTEIVNVRFIVGENLGFSVDVDALDFGRLVPGSSNSRNMEIENTYDFPVKIKILVSKNLVNLIEAEQNIILQSGNKEKIPVTLKIPENMAYGNYTGKIKFEFRKL